MRWEGCLKGMEGGHFLLSSPSFLRDYLKWPQKVKGATLTQVYPKLCLAHIGPHFPSVFTARREPRVRLPLPFTQHQPSSLHLPGIILLAQVCLGHNALLCAPDLVTRGKFMLKSAGPLKRLLQSCLPGLQARTWAPGIRSPGRKGHSFLSPLRW